MGNERNPNNRETPADFGSQKTIPVVEEQLRVEKRIVDTGSLHVMKDIEEKEVVIDTTLTEDALEVKRIPMNRPVEGTPPPVRYEGDTMIISVVQEEIVLHRRLVLTEEVHITKKRIQRDIQHPVTLKKEKISFEHDRHAGADSEERI